MYFTGVAVMTI